MALQITKTASVAQIFRDPGENQFDYTITVLNTGPSQIINFSLVDSLPTGVTAVGAPIGTIPTTLLVGVPYTKVQRVAVSPTTPLGTVITNTAFGSGVDLGPDGLEGPQLSDPGPPPVFVNDDVAVAVQAEASVLVDRIADVSVTKSDQFTLPQSGAAGGPVTYNITVTNNGPDPARNVNVFDNFPPGVFVEQITRNGVPIPGTNLNDTIVTIAPNASVTYQVFGIFSPGLPDFSIVRNEVTLSSSDITDNNRENNKAFDETTVVGLDVEIVVSKTDQRTTAAVGERVTYIVTVRNEGPDDIQGTVSVNNPFPPATGFFRDLIPANLTDVTFTASGTGGAFGFLPRGFSANEREDFSDANKALLNFGDGGISLPAGAVITYVITGIVTAGPELVNTAQFGTTTFLRDPNTNPSAPNLITGPIEGVYFSPNNQATDRTTVGGTSTSTSGGSGGSTAGSLVSIVASDPTAAESGNNSGRFTFTRTGSTTEPLTVAFTVGGTATNSVDYESIGGVVVIPAGSSTVDLPIVPIDDTSVEGTETVVLTLLPLSGYSIQSGVSAATVEILDNDVAPSTTPTPTPTPTPAPAPTPTPTPVATVPPLSVPGTPVAPPTGSTTGEVIGGVLRLAQPTANTVPPESFQGLPTGILPTFGFSGGFFNLSDGPDQVSLDRFQTGGAPIRGLSGNDFIIGTENPEDIAGNQGLDTIFGAGGNDILRGGAGADSLDGGEGNDSLFGNMDNDTLLGGPGNDLLRGGQGDDVLFGGLGSDTLGGDFGQDFLTGGAGADLFVLRPGAAASTQLTRADVIVDFRADEGDRIGLAEGLNFNNLVFGFIELAIDNEPQPVGSTTIRNGANGEWVGIVRGLAPSFLQANPQLFQTAFI